TCHSTYPTSFTTCPKDQTLLHTASELMPGLIIREKYQIVERIGAGGMAVVYKAKHVAFNEVHALKVVASRMMDDEGFLHRFRNEAIITRKLHHLNAVRVDDIDSTEDGRPFIVMEYVRGENLRNVIQKHGALRLARALHIARQVAQALAAAHHLGITHRDIKPDNIILMEQADGHDLVKVLDFGIAKVRESTVGSGAGYTPTHTGMVVGTPQYISPEQALGKHGNDIDGRADLYSLGVVLYEMVTGQLPFESDTPMGLLLHHIQTPPRPPDLLRPDLRIPQAISKLLLKSLAKQREDRFQSAEEMLAALKDPEAWASEAGTSVLGSEELAAAAAPAPAPPATRGAVALAPRPALTPRPRRVLTPLQLRRAPAPRSRPWGAIGGLVLLLLLLATWGYYLLRHELPLWPGSAPPSSAAAAPTRSDEEIAAAVSSALTASPALKGETIGVAVHAGVVTLTGPLDTPAQASAAIALASAVPGAKRVSNQMKVRPTVEHEAPAAAAAESKPPPDRDEERARRAQQAGRRARDLVTGGDRQLNDGDYDAAIASFQAALQAEPGNRAARQGLARAQQAKRAEEEILKRRR
ncbi:MAG TPA: protein kinase, partial [Terriglobales bacterium]|nr:protein kinase [Terriglobales bacterium]